MMENKYNIKRYEELTYCGAMLLRILGNSSPSLSQMEFAQAFISLIGEEDPTKSNRLINLISRYATLSRELIQRDVLYQRIFG